MEKLAENPYFQCLSLWKAMHFQAYKLVSFSGISCPSGFAITTCQFADSAIETTIQSCEMADRISEVPILSMKLQSLGGNILQEKTTAHSVPQSVWIKFCDGRWDLAAIVKCCWRYGANSYATGHLSLMRLARRSKLRLMHYLRSPGQAAFTKMWWKSSMQTQRKYGGFQTCFPAFWWPQWSDLRNTKKICRTLY